MIQEIIALTIVFGASIITIYKIIRFFKPSKSRVPVNHAGGCSKCKK